MIMIIVRVSINLIPAIPNKDNDHYGNNKITEMITLTNDKNINDKIITIMINIIIMLNVSAHRTCRMSSPCAFTNF